MNCAHCKQELPDMGHYKVQVVKSGISVMDAPLCNEQCLHNWIHYAYDATITTQAAEIERLRADYNEGVSEFNAGFDAFGGGLKPEDEPSGLKHDFWLVGWAWAQYRNSQKDVHPTPPTPQPETPVLSEYGRRMVRQNRKP